MTQIQFSVSQKFLNVLFINRAGRRYICLFVCLLLEPRVPAQPQIKLFVCLLNAKACLGLVSNPMISSKPVLPLVNQGFHLFQTPKSLSITHCSIMPYPHTESSFYIMYYLSDCWLTYCVKVSFIKFLCTFYLRLPPKELKHLSIMRIKGYEKGYLWEEISIFKKGKHITIWAIKVILG